jgi:phosphatidate cytidylyltransferase
MRVLTSLVLIPLITWVVLFAPQIVFLAVVCLFAGLCWHEFAGLARRYGACLDTYSGLLSGIAFLLLRQNEWLFAAALALAAMAFALRVADLKQAIPSAAFYSLGLLYVFGAWRAAIALHEISSWWLLFALVINWAGDSAAYYVGRAIGKHKLAPRVSPGKSWEGAVASVLFAAAVGVAILHFALPQTPLFKAAILALAGNAAGQLGDLAESAMKRGAGVKDSGTLLPGHGGWLDRLDSSLFSMPAVYLLLLVLHLDR